MAPRRHPDRDQLRKLLADEEVRRVRKLGAGGTACPLCGHVGMLPSLSGRGYCRKCGPNPVYDLPCAPLTWSKSQILKIRDKWIRSDIAREIRESIGTNGIWKKVYE